MLRLLIALAALFGCASSALAQPLRPKVVIVSYFETSRLPGQEVSPSVWGDSGGRSDRPGELRYWVEREHLTRVIPVPGVFNPVYANADGSVIALKVGPNSLHPAVNIMALGLDPQFDLSRSYWLFNGIAGITPQGGTIGDMVWTDFVVNGDVGHEIDAREIPAGWPTGYFPAGKSQPYQQPRVAAGTHEDIRTWPADRFDRNGAGTVIALNRGLARWALAQTQGVALVDDDAMKAQRARYAGYPAGQAPPSVKIGATLSSETFWHGKLLDQWAVDWTRYMTDGQAAYLTTETNDAGSMTAIAALTNARRVDPNRVLLLRAASNFDMPPPGVSAADNLAGQGPGSYAAYLPSLEGAWRVGSKVVHALVDGWTAYADRPPQP